MTAASYFRQILFKSPLNWLKCTRKIFGASPQNAMRPPLSSHPGSATDTATPRGRHCHIYDDICPIGSICAFWSMHTYSGRREGRFCEKHIVEKGWGYILGGRSRFRESRV